MAENNRNKQLTGNALMELADLISRQQYNYALVRARQIAEGMVKGYAVDANIEYTTLAETIEQLYRAGNISRLTRDSLHQLRMLGNKAAHEGDDDPNDARGAYYLLKDEMQTYATRYENAGIRPTVKVEKTRREALQNIQDDASAPDGIPGTAYVKARNRETSQARSDRARRNQNSQENVRSTKRQSGTNRRGGGNRRPRSEEERYVREGGFSIYDVLRILIPILIILVLIVLIRSVMPDSSKKKETKPAATTQENVIKETKEEKTTEAVEETTKEPETTAAPVKNYKIKGDVVNIRFADNQDRVYTQLTDGYQIGRVEPIEGSDFVKFTLDGVSVVVSKNFITPDE